MVFVGCFVFDFKIFWWISLVLKSLKFKFFVTQRCLVFLVVFLIVGLWLRPWKHIKKRTVTVKVTKYFPGVEPRVYDLSLEEWLWACWWRRHPWPLVWGARICGRSSFPDRRKFFTWLFYSIVPRKGTWKYDFFYFFFNPLERTAFYVTFIGHILHLLITKTPLYVPIYFIYEYRRRYCFKKTGFMKLREYFGRVDRMTLENFFYETSYYSILLELFLTRQWMAFWWKEYKWKKFWFLERACRLIIQRYQPRNHYCARFLKSYFPGGFVYRRPPSKRIRNDPRRRRGNVF